MGTTAKLPILVIEDNVVSRRLLEKLLTKAGYDVTATENGIQALRIFEKKHFPLVLSDWMMPEMNGLDLCKAIRKRKNDAYTFIILLTAKASKEDIVKGFEAGVDDYLTKPFNHAELIARLKSGTRIINLERSLKKANAHIKALSTRDPLTCCFNRVYMNEHLSLEFNRAKRYKRSLALVFCDIDHFKNVNDSYGHQIGDYVLKEFARFLIQNTRRNIDWVVRYGGEEFLIVAPETNIEGATRMAERIRQAIESHSLKAKGKRFNITASFGVTEYDPFLSENDISIEMLINQADQFLYQAKEEGRNRVKADKFIKFIQP